MRQTFCRSLVENAGRPEFVFLTGDLGFKALEPLRDALGERFVNAGVAEQNMVSVAAGLARNGLRAWVYSIAPFVYARPFEQIKALFEVSHPVYLRLGLSEEPAGVKVPPYAPWRKLQDGGGCTTVLVVGTLVGGIWGAVRQLGEASRPSLWCLCELPFEEIPESFRADLARSRRLLVVEEHVTQGGLGRVVGAELLKSGPSLERFATRSAGGYVSGRYGSQKFHRRECGLDPESIVRFLTAECVRDAG
jgi:transketolase